MTTPSSAPVPAASVDEQVVRRSARMRYLWRYLIGVLVVLVAVIIWAAQKSSHENDRQQRLEKLGAAVQAPEHFAVTSSSYSAEKGDVQLAGDWPCPDAGSSCADDLASTLVSWMSGMGINDVSQSDLSSGLMTSSSTVDRTFSDHTTSVNAFCIGLGSVYQAAHCTLEVDFKSKG